MYLENVVVDATDPQTLGRFWETALGTEPLTDEEAGYETRLAVPDGPVIDLCFQKVPEPPQGPQRLHLALSAAADQVSVVARMLSLGASPAADLDRLPGVGLTDVEGHPFRVLAAGPDAEEGPVAAMVLDVSRPDRDRDFWAWLSGWVPGDAAGPVVLRHPSRRGPALELSPEAGPKGAGKNRMHLDIRLERGDDVYAVAEETAVRGGSELHFDWGDLPYRHFADPSGNEFCLLPAR